MFVLSVREVTRSNHCAFTLSHVIGDMILDTELDLNGTKNALS
jgi:hypothetical protein